MKIAAINTVHYGSTGKIMLQIAQEAECRGHITQTYSKTWKDNTCSNQNHRYIGKYTENLFHRVFAPLTASEGSYSRRSTKALISELKRFSPDVLHLHNLHGWYLNLPLLFRYIKENNVRVIWTLHDCWAFTGQCPHFVLQNCEKWKNGCYRCSQHRQYPEMMLDRTKQMWRKKKKWFQGVSDLTVVTPSDWLAELTKQSFLKNYPVKVIHNGIDLSIFTPLPSDFKKTHRCEGKYLILGVAFAWGKRKGLDVFIELAHKLPPEYQIALVGTTKQVEKWLPPEIICIRKTMNAHELAEIYSAADLFVNPTREENFPTVNIEALACGTPVLTFATGGSPEIIDETCGSVVPCDDVSQLEQEIRRICLSRPYSVAACTERAKRFEAKKCFEEYVKLYEQP